MTVEKTQVVAKALMNVKEEFSISNEVVGGIIGADASTVFRIGKKGDMKENKSYEAALLLIRVYRSLYALFGGSKKAMYHWLNTENQDFQKQKPVSIMASWIGLVEVVQYLDEMRGHA
ncbi:MbcA/ParS/Xre antitoxin family protein [Thiomicrorhabdus sp. Milos-T2]|uniref:MbcA/ParS/Xre antitoxin family protein n=1 Tax=Thiomicrorhabdus sp. Milos-T2 TaxID=90814 RepID=UPI00049412E4|nr:MbcA/ParS/Xre antitoxin family protein [Thiomicrorhabdus sp. Milos-T2]